MAFESDLITGVVALVGDADLAFAVDQDGVRVLAFGVVDRDHTAFGVEEDGEAEAKAESGGADLGLGLGFVGTDRKDLEALGVVALVKALEVGEFFEARLAPGGPKVQQDHLSSVGLEVVGTALEVLQGEGRGGALGLRNEEGGRAVFADLRGFAPPDEKEDEQKQSS